MHENHTADREHLIRAWAGQLLRKLSEVVPAKPVEADFRHAVEPIIDRFCQVTLNIARLEKGELVISHATFRQPVKVSFPRPAYRQAGAS